MSYDVYLRREKCAACGHEDRGPDLPDPTYNLSPIFDLALTGKPRPTDTEYQREASESEQLWGLRHLNGRRAKDTVEQLREACDRLCDPARRAEFQALEPSNKWGDLAGATEVVAKLYAAAREFPEHVWEVH